MPARSDNSETQSQLETGKLRPWQVWAYSLSLVTAGIFFCLLIFRIIAISGAGNVQLPYNDLAWLFIGKSAFLSGLLSLPLRLAAFAPQSDSPLRGALDVQLHCTRKAWKMLLYSSVVLALAMIFTPADYAGSGFILPNLLFILDQLTLDLVCRAVVQVIGMLALLGTLIGIGFLAGTNEHAFLALSGLKQNCSKWILNAGRLAFYIVNPLLGILYLIRVIRERRLRRECARSLPA